MMWSQVQYFYLVYKSRHRPISKSYSCVNIFIYNSYYYYMTSHIMQNILRKMNFYFHFQQFSNINQNLKGDCRGRVGMVVEFTTTYAISAYHQ